MLLVIKSKADEETLQKVAQDLDGYIKWVVDIEQEILTAGGLRHFEGEQLLISQEGSSQKNLWGGGLDPKTNEIDFESMINIRPRDNNPDKIVISPDLRIIIEKIVRNLLR